MHLGHTFGSGDAHRAAEDPCLLGVAGSVDLLQWASVARTPARGGRRLDPGLQEAPRAYLDR